MTHHHSQISVARDRRNRYVDDKRNQVTVGSDLFAANVQRPRFALLVIPSKSKNTLRPRIATRLIALRRGKGLVSYSRRGSLS